MDSSYEAIGSAKLKSTDVICYTIDEENKHASNSPLRESRRETSPYIGLNEILPVD